MAKLAGATSADSVAIILGNEGVRKSKCGDPYKCALAQYFANETGAIASVDGSSVELYPTLKDARKYENTIARHSLPQVCNAFVGAFDRKQYSFLTK